MDRAQMPYIMFLGCLLIATGCAVPTSVGGQDFVVASVAPGILVPSMNPEPSPNPQTVPELPPLASSPAEDRPLPINFLNAMQLADLRAVDIAAATERMRVAAAGLEGAEALWLPTVTLGGDYYRHDGKTQDTLGNVFDNSRSGAMLGVGTGIGPAAILDVGQAIFAPLAARQQLRAREAARQTASNDTLVALSDAYFTVQQARGELAGANETTRRTEDLITRTRKLAPAIVPELELYRAEAELARRQEAELLARERWKVSGAELLRLLRLDPAAQVEPVEPPHLRVVLIDLEKSVDDLVAVGLTYRPELASQQAQVQTTLTLLRQERLRPLIPSVLLRGFSTPVTGTLGAGYFGGGSNSTIGNGGLRSDFDLQLIWQLNNLGLGNRALMHQRDAENRLAVVELFRIQDRVAAEVAQAYAQAQQAARRVEVTEKGLKSAKLSADKNLEALSQTKAVGNQMVTLVRPQEVVAAIQALAQLYASYYAAVADANRAQFRLYRALGQPAQYLIQEQQKGNLCETGLVVPPKSENPSPPAIPDAGSGANQAAKIPELKKPE